MQQKRVRSIIGRLCVRILMKKKISVIHPASLKSNLALELLAWIGRKVHLKVRVITDIMASGYHLQHDRKTDLDEE